MPQSCSQTEGQSQVPATLLWDPVPAVQSLVMPVLLWAGAVATPFWKRGGRVGAMSV
jgi:hypothetical protein